METELLAAVAAEHPGDQPAAHGTPPVRGRLRCSPEDFRVEEVLGFDPDGDGSHVMLVVEKRGANTGWVAAQLARAASVAVRDVGWSGHKDRHAITRQSFTLPWSPAAPIEPCLRFCGEGYRVVAASRHGRKLRPGSHRANRFEIRVRDLEGDHALIGERMEAIAALGVPSYFGPQRFGRDGGNLLSARRWAGSGIAPPERQGRAFALSAARSSIFNAVLAERVRRCNWNRLLEGEAVILDGRRSFFPAGSIDQALEARCSSMDVHPSGPLWGRGDPPSLGEARAVESVVAAAEPQLCELLAAQGLDHERRSLRVPVRDLDWGVDSEGLLLRFSLPRGTFATAVLHEIVHDAWSAGLESGD